MFGQLKNDEGERSMTVYEKKMIEDIQEQIERLSRELNKLKESPRPVSEFERLETDDFLLQTYN
ncbi:hypothetical protein BTS2_3945 [Bacillus sp. TS-2]|nr:hypothetical protein BTS2_3945 [Bacillus sp. TS-2]